MSLKFCLFLLLVISVTSSNNIDDKQESEVKSRTKRATIWDFFQKVAITSNLAVDQYTDTKNTLNDIYDLIADTFTDSKPKQTRTTTTTTTPTPDEDGNIPTTTEKYRISRYEFGKIAGRNFRGLNRLLKIEINDALNQSHYNIAGYQREAQMQFNNSIIAEKKAVVKGIPVTSSSSNMTSTSNATQT